jgi:hypothetical protein
MGQRRAIHRLRTLGSAQARRIAWPINMPLLVVLLLTLVSSCLTLAHRACAALRALALRCSAVRIGIVEFTAFRVCVARDRQGVTI